MLFWWRTFFTGIADFNCSCHIGNLMTCPRIVDELWICMNFINVLYEAHIKSKYQHWTWSFRPKTLLKYDRNSLSDPEHLFSYTYLLVGGITDFAISQISFPPSRESLDGGKETQHRRYRKRQLRLFHVVWVFFKINGLFENELVCLTSYSVTTNIFRK